MTVTATTPVDERVADAVAFAEGASALAGLPTPDPWEHDLFMRVANHELTVEEALQLVHERMNAPEWRSTHPARDTSNNSRYPSEFFVTPFPE